MLLIASSVLGFISLVTMVAGAAVSITSGYKAYNAANKAAGKQETATLAAANAQRLAAQAQADQARDQASLASLQASIEEKKAGIAQEQGRIEEQRRMVQLSYDIGNMYSQWAGNGLLVDSGNDTLGQLLTANTREAGEDVGIIRTNTENAVWEHSMNQSMALLSASNYMNQASNFETIGEANANATLLSGAAQAYATRQAGVTALYQGWGSGLSMLGNAAGTAYKMYGDSDGTNKKEA